MIDPVWSPLIALVCTLVAYSLRRFTPSASWLHTAFGAFVIMVVTTGLDALGEAIKAGGLHGSAIIPGICAAIGGLVAASNPSARKGDSEEPGKSGVSAALPLLFAGALGLAFSGCAAVPCLLGKLPAAGQVAIASATAIAMDTSSTVETLEQAALKLAPGVFECALVALTDYWSNHAAGALTPQMRHAQEVSQQFLARHHASACSHDDKRAAWSEGKREVVAVCDVDAEGGAEMCRTIVIEMGG